MASPYQRKPPSSTENILAYAQKFWVTPGNSYGLKSTSLNGVLCKYCLPLDLHAVLQNAREVDWNAVQGDYRHPEVRSRPTALRGAKVLEFDATCKQECGMCRFLPPEGKFEDRPYLLKRFAVYAFRGSKLWKVVRERRPEEYAELCEWNGAGNKGEDDLQEDWMVFTVQNVEWGEWYKMGWPLWEFFSILEEGSGAARRSLHRQIPRNIDTSLLKHWFVTCEESHPECRNGREGYTSKGLTYGLRVIECEAQIVVDAPMHCSYLALSYVWGRRDVFPFDARPQTIFDAMALVLQLGKRYLWVDKYCINQHPITEEEKTHQLRQLNAMGETYGCAFATIVAAEGKSEDHGLPGITRTARKPQQNVVVKDGLRCIKECTTPPTAKLNSNPIMGDWNRTVWGKRGWTFQEGLLSSRLLFFFDDEVYFECASVTCREGSRVISKKTSHWCEPPGTLRWQLDRARTPRDLVTTLFWVCVEDYYARILTYDADVLVALTGVIQKFAEPPLEGSLEAMPSLMGVPLLHSSVVATAPIEVSAILPGLGWKFSSSSLRDGVVRRRRNGDGKAILPSWTWAAWSGGFIKMPDVDQHGSEFFPFATVAIPTGSPATYLRIDAPIRRAVFEDGKLIPCDGTDSQKLPYDSISNRVIARSHLQTRTGRDTEPDADRKDDGGEMAVMYGYISTYYPQYPREKAFVMNLKWLDEGKTRAERIGGREIPLGDYLKLSSGGWRERRVFDLY